VGFSGKGEVRLEARCYMAALTHLFIAQGARGVSMNTVEEIPGPGRSFIRPVESRGHAANKGAKNKKPRERGRPQSLVDCNSAV